MSDTSDDNTPELETVTLMGVPEDHDYETIGVEEIDYAHGLLEDEDSNIGSMVSIQSEEDVEDEESELVVPDVLEEQEIEINESQSTDTEHKDPVESNNNPETYPLESKSKPESWPTLEILPGGVINLTDKYESAIINGDEDFGENEMVYACAKCPKRFKMLFCLVKHVKWHEDQAKKSLSSDLTKLGPLERQFVEIQRERQLLQTNHKRKKIEVYSRIAESFAKLENLEDLL